jgi:stage II sporulation protein E
MEKLEQNYIEPVSNVHFEKMQSSFYQWWQKLERKCEYFFFNKGFILILIGFLLGRALILSKITPFALPFFAAVFMIRQNKLAISTIALTIGALTLSWNTLLFILTSIVVFLLLRKISMFFNLDSIKTLPFLVFFASIISKLSIVYFTSQQLNMYELMMAGVESGLSFILTLIFLQSVPLLSTRKRKQTLKTEEIISLIIMLASVMTGAVGWEIYNLSLEHIMSRYLVLLFSFVAGAAIGSTVGVVTGLILSLSNLTSLYQMSLLAFAGLLGGLLKDGRKIGVSVGLIIGTLLIGLYGEGSQNVMTTVYESLAAVILFMLTPPSITEKLAKHIPGTAEHAAEQQHYLRKIRDVTAHRVAQFSNVFAALSNSFASTGMPHDEIDEDREIDYFLGNVTEKTCQTCFKKEHCWAKNFDKTYDLMKQIMHASDQNSFHTDVKLAREWDKHCVKSKKVVEAIQKEITYYQANRKLKKQVLESRRIVAEQLLGVSQVMGDFAKEIQRERENHHIQEEQILDALQNFGIEIGHVDIYSVEQGNVDIEMSIPYCNGRGECEKLIAPMLSDILEETIVVKKEECAVYPNGYCHVSFTSAKAYVIDTGVAHAAKGGGLVSGDSYSMIELGAGKYAIAISDGMGNGERAHYESNETLQLLKKILQTGIEEKLAIKSVNSVLTLRTNDEIFSTLDLAVIDLQDASAKFLKIGSSPSFVKRGDKILTIQSSNLPIGIIDDFEVDVVGEQLKAGDLLIMMSDGIFEGPKHVENHDVWMKRKIREIQTDDPQAVADLIMEEVIRTRGGHIEDDMTVVVAKINHNTPKWAAIPAYSYRKIAQ